MFHYLTDLNVSIIVRFECYFSLERKVTKSSRLHRLRCYGERLRLKNPKLASLKQRIFPSRFVFPLRGRSPAEGLSENAKRSLGMADTDTFIIQQVFSTLTDGIGNPKRKLRFL